MTIKDAVHVCKCIPNHPYPSIYTSLMYLQINLKHTYAHGINNNLSGYKIIPYSAFTNLQIKRIPNTHQRQRLWLYHYMHWIDSLLTTQSISTHNKNNHGHGTSPCLNLNITSTNQSIKVGLWHAELLSNRRNFWTIFTFHFILFLWFQILEYS